MRPTLDEATARFLLTLEADLQRQMGTAGNVEELTLTEDESGVTLLARVLIGRRVVTFSASGQTTVEAYGALTRAGAVQALGEAYRQIVDP